MIEFLKQIIAGLIVWLKAIPHQIWTAIKQRIVYSITIYQNDPLYDDFEAWFYSTHTNKYRNIEAGMKKAKGDYGVPETERNANPFLIFYRQIEGFFVMPYKGRLLFIRKGREKLEHAADVRSISMSDVQAICSMHQNDINKAILELSFSFVDEDIIAHI